MNKNIKRLFSNLGIFTIANFSTKVLSFLILPLYTTYLSTEEYGSIDLATTLIQLLFPVFTFAISEAVVRFGISENEKLDEIFSLGIRQVSIATIPMVLVGVIYAAIVHSVTMGVLLFILYVVEGYNSLFANFAKSIGMTKQMAIVSTLISTIILGLNVLFVAFFKWRIWGYFLSLILGNIVGIILYIYLCQIRYFLSKVFIKIEPALKKEMFAYSVPLIPNAIFWWINSSLDRWTLTIISSISVVGVYAVANKLPTIISTVSTIFSQAWNLSIFQSEQGEQKNFFEKSYSFYVEVMFCCTMGIIMLCKIFAKIAFVGDFFVAWKLVPILTAGVFFSSLNSVLGSLFTTNKDTKYIFTTTLVGSIINCVLNIPFVLWWDAFGAAIATAISYISVFVVRTYKIHKLYEINCGVIKTIFKSIILVILSVVAIMDCAWILVYLITVIYCLGFVASTSMAIYKKHIKSLN